MRFWLILILIIVPLTLYPLPATRRKKTAASCLNVLLIISDDLYAQTWATWCSRLYS